MKVQTFEQNGVKVEMYKVPMTNFYTVRKLVKDKQVDTQKLGTNLNFEDASDIFGLLVESVKSPVKRKKVLGLF